MLFRTVVNHFLRQTAEEKIREAVNKSGKKQDASPDKEIPPCDVAFIFALSFESGGFVDLLSDVVTTRCHSFLEYTAQLNKQRIVVVDSGVGCDSARIAAEELITVHRPKWIISAGFAGGLQDELRCGHILMANKIVDCHGKQLSVGMNIDSQTIAGSKSLHSGRLLTVDHLVQKETEKRALGKKYDALACDMETMAVAEVCQQQKVRFLSVRIISDAVNDTLPPEVARLLNQKTFASKMGAAAAAIFNRPGSVKDMWKLKEDALKASDRLAKFLVSMLPQLTE